MDSVFLFCLDGHGYALGMVSSLYPDATTPLVILFIMSRPYIMIKIADRGGIVAFIGTHSLPLPPTFKFVLQAMTGSETTHNLQ